MRDQTWGVHIIHQNPLVVTVGVALVSHQVFQSSCHHPVVENLFNLNLVISIPIDSCATHTPVVFWHYISQGQSNPVLEASNMHKLMVLQVMGVDKTIVQATSQLDDLIRSLPRSQKLLAPLLLHHWHIEPDLIAQLEWLILLVVVVAATVVLLGLKLMLLGSTES